VRDHRGGGRASGRETVGPRRGGSAGEARRSPRSA
jgi:chorismate synthase